MAPTRNDVKHGLPTMTNAAIEEKTQDFSLVLGGPIFQLFRKAHLSGDHLELLHRRMITITLIAWLPLLILDRLGTQAGGIGQLTFLHDLEVRVRFLVALPVLIVAELIVHSRLRLVVQRFVERRIVRDEDVPRFEAAIESAVRLCNSIPVEVVLLITVYTLGLWLWNSRFGIESATWYAMPGGRWHLTPAGYWYVSICCAGSCAAQLCARAEAYGLAVLARRRGNDADRHHRGGSGHQQRSIDVVCRGVRPDGLSGLCDDPLSLTATSTMNPLFDFFT